MPRWVGSCKPFSDLAALQIYCWDPWDHRPKEADTVLTPVPPAHRREAWKARTSVKLDRGGFLSLSTRAAVGFTCFEFLKGGWVEYVSLSRLSGWEMLGDKAAREGVLAEATHLAGGVCVILLGVRGEWIVRGLGKESGDSLLVLLECVWLFREPWADTLQMLLGPLPV